MTDDAAPESGRPPDIGLVRRSIRRAWSLPGAAQRVLTGDAAGTALFVGALLFFALTWRIGPFVNDNYTVANALVAVADGHLQVTAFRYGPPDGATPRMHLVDGALYGRNYALVVLSLPVLWLLSAATAVLDASTTVALLWSGLCAAVAVSDSRHLEQGTAVAAGGVGLSVLVLAANVAFSRPVDPRWHAWMALQLTTMCAAALAVTFVYRLLARMYGRRTGVVAGIGAALGTPVGFWATIPKRHSLVALCAVVTLYCFYRSRAADAGRRRTRFRALAYVPVGLAAWSFAVEGAVLLAALATVDAATAPTSDPRELAVVAGALAVSLLPFLVTNALISGNPFRPPVLLPKYKGGTVAAAVGAPGGDGGAGGGWVDTAGSLLAALASYLAVSLSNLFDPNQVFRAFVSGGHGAGLQPGILGGRRVNLSVLESMPLVGAFVVSPLVLYRWAQATSRDAAWRSVVDDPARATDLLAVGYALVLTFVYVRYLTAHAMLTVRYLHPLYLVAVYLLVRLGVVRSVVRNRTKLLATAYVGITVLGLPALALVARDLPGLEAAIRSHARIALLAAAGLAYWAVVATAYEGYERVGAVALALAGAVTTSYVVLAGLLYFPYTDQFALPVVRIVAELLAAG